MKLNIANFKTSECRSILLRGGVAIPVPNAPIGVIAPPAPEDDEPRDDFARSTIDTFLLPARLAVPARSDAMKDHEYFGRGFSREAAHALVSKARDQTYGEHRVYLVLLHVPRLSPSDAWVTTVDNPLREHPAATEGIRDSNHCFSAPASLVLDTSLYDVPGLFNPSQGWLFRDKSENSLLLYRIITAQIAKMLTYELEQALIKYPTNLHLLHACSEELGETVQASIDHDLGGGDVRNISYEGTQLLGVITRMLIEGTSPGFSATLPMGLYQNQRRVNIRKLAEEAGKR